RPVPAQQRHCGPRTRQGLRDREADAATAPRHEGDLAGEIDLHRPAAPNAACGMRNAECTWERREASELSLKSRIPHSAFRIWSGRLQEAGDLIGSSNRDRV